MAEPGPCATAAAGVAARHVLRLVRILCVCDHGVNRSVHVADQLRFRGHETIPVGAKHLSDETRQLLSDWADMAIFTGHGQQELFPPVASETWLLPEHPRPYAPATLQLVRGYIERSGL